MSAAWSPCPQQTPSDNLDREPLALTARLAWKDRRGVPRFASVVTRDVSDTEVFVECDIPVSIPLYRLVQFQLERHARATAPLPIALRQGRVLSAVSRIDAPHPGQRQGLALRLLVEHGRAAAPRRPSANLRH